MIDIRKALVEAFEHGKLTDEVLPPVGVSAKNSPFCDSSQKTGASLDVLPSLIYQLADTLHSEVLPDTVKALFAYDGGMELTFYGSWGVSAGGVPISDFLKPLKDKAVEENKALQVDIAGLRFLLLPRGEKIGIGNFSYVLIFEENNRVKYRVMLHRYPTASIPGIRIKCEYQAFRDNRRLSDLQSELHEIIKILGFEVERERLSRIDFNVTINHSMAFINEAVKNDNVLNRCQEIFTTGGRKFFTSYRVGKHDNIQFAVYDKLKELTDKYDADKIADLQSFFNCIDEPLTRYEFRLGRSFLHEIKIDTFQDYIDSELSVVNYLTYVWYQVVDDASKRFGKRIDYKVSAFWRQVRLSMLIAVLTGQFGIVIGKDTLPEREDGNHTGLNIIGRCDEYASLTRKLPIVKRRPTRNLRKNLKRLVQVGVGCLASALFAVLPSDQSFTEAQFNRALVDSVSYFSSDCFERYKDRFNTFEGLEKDLSQVHTLEKTLLGGC